MTLPFRYYILRGVEETFLRFQILNTYYYQIAPAIYEWKYGRRTTGYGAPLTIFKLIKIEPEKIIYESGRETLTTGSERRLNIGTKLSGDWDLNPGDHIEERHNFVHQAIVDHFENDVPWKQTELYQWALRQIKIEGQHWHNCQTSQDVDDRFAEIEELYYTIRENGYKSQREIDRYSTDFVNCYLNEVCVDIGRNGDMFLVDGRHRLAIAKVLDLDTIPVFPVVRHTEWMKKREHVHNSDHIEKHKNMHPDLLEIID